MCLNTKHCTAKCFFFPSMLLQERTFLTATRTMDLCIAVVFINRLVDGAMAASVNNITDSSILSTREQLVIGLVLLIACSF